MKMENGKIINKTSIFTGRRDFIKSVSAGALGVASMGINLPEIEADQKKSKSRSRDEKLKNMASNSYAVNQLFKRRIMQGRSERPETLQLKEKYRELTLFDFPQFTRDTYPGVEAMDLWSSLFGDVTDDTMFTRIERENQVRIGEFDPSSLSSKSYLDMLVTKMVAAGVMATHISNNAPRNLADLNEEMRSEGIRIGKLWLDASRQIGVKSMRGNTGGPQIIPASVIQGGYPRNEG